MEASDDELCSDAVQKEASIPATLKAAARAPTRVSVYSFVNPKTKSTVGDCQGDSEVVNRGSSKE